MTAPIPDFTFGTTFTSTEYPDDGEQQPVDSSNARSGGGDVKAPRGSVLVHMATADDVNEGDNDNAELVGTVVAATSRSRTVRVMEPPDKAFGDYNGSPKQCSERFRSDSDDAFMTSLTMSGALGSGRVNFRAPPSLSIAQHSVLVRSVLHDVALENRRKSLFNKSQEKMAAASQRRATIMASRAMNRQTELWVRALSAVRPFQILMEPVRRVRALQTLLHLCVPMLQRFCSMLKRRRSLKTAQLRHPPACAVISHLPLVHGWPKKLVDYFTGLFDVVLLPEGGHVFFQGELGFSMYYIVAGTVELLVAPTSRPALQKGRGKSVGDSVVMTLTDGKTFGDGALLTEEARAESAYCATSCVLWRVTKYDFDHCLRLLPDDIGQRIQKDIVERRQEIIESHFRISDAALSEQSQLGIELWTHAMKSQFLSRVKAKTYRAGDSIYSVDERPQSTYFIVRGRVRVGDAVVPSSDSTRMIGHHECMLRCPRMQSAVCILPTDVWWIDRADLFDVLLTRPDVLAQTVEDAIVFRSGFLPPCPRKLLTQTAMPLLRNLPKAVVDGLHAALVPRYYEPKACIVQEGDACSHAVLLAKGSARGLKSGSEHKAGSVVGGSWELLDGTMWRETIVAASEVHAYCLPRTAYMGAFLEMPSDVRQQVKAAAAERARVLGATLRTVEAERSVKLTIGVSPRAGSKSPTRLMSPNTSKSPSRPRSPEVPRGAIYEELPPQHIVTSSPLVSPRAAVLLPQSTAEEWDDSLDGMHVPEVLLPESVLSLMVDTAPPTRVSMAPVGGELESVSFTRKAYRSSQYHQFDTMGLLRRPKSSKIHSSKEHAQPHPPYRPGQQRRQPLTVPTSAKPLFTTPAPSARHPCPPSDTKILATSPQQVVVPKCIPVRAPVPSCAPVPHTLPRVRISQQQHQAVNHRKGAKKSGLYTMPSSSLSLSPSPVVVPVPPQLPVHMAIYRKQLRRSMMHMSQDYV
eukprot:PhM_4_TR16860/c0_g1_i1/m.39565